MATILRSQLDKAALRRSSDDLARIVEALRADGSLTVEDDPEPEQPDPQLDENGEEMKDSEGNVILQAPQARPLDNEGLVIKTDKDLSAVVIPEEYVVETAPGTQNAAAPFPEDTSDMPSPEEAQKQSEEAAAAAAS